MTPATRELLAKYDEPRCWEFPSDPSTSFSWDLAAKIHSELSALAGASLDLDRNVQDASHLTTIGLLSKRDRTYIHEFAFRLSNFGFLFTVYGEELEKWSEVVRKGIALVQSLGGQFVSADELDEPYDGVNPTPAEASFTWWIRFFDYL